MNYHFSPSKLLSIPLCILITLLCVKAFATEPEPPIDIWDEQVAKGHVLLIINPHLVQAVKVEQALYQDGKVLQQEKVDFRKYKVAKAPKRLGLYRPQTEERKEHEARTKRPYLKLEFSEQARKELFSLLERKEIKFKHSVPESEQRFAVAVPVMSFKARKMPDGYYASKFVANAKWRKGGVSPIHVEQWVYLKASKGRVTPISLEEYSRRVDPVSKSLDANDRPIKVHIGKGSPEEKDIKDTKRSMAVPLGRLGGEPLEQPERRTKAMEKKTVDESNER